MNLSEACQKKWVVSDRLILAIVFIVAFFDAVKLITILTAPWDTTSPESAIVYSILAVSGSDHALYRDFSKFPYTTTPYAPLFYLFSGWLAKLFGGSVNAAYLAGRTVSLLAFGASLRLVYSLALRTGASWRSALFAACLACSLPITYPWATSCRPDFLAVAFSLWGLSLLRPNVKSSLQSRTILAWLAAFFTKPSFIAGPVMWTLYLLFKRDWKAAFKFAAIFGFAAIIGLLLTEYLSGGEYIANIVKANVTHISFDGSKKIIMNKLFWGNGGANILILSVLGICQSWMNRPRTGTSDSFDFVRLLLLFAVASSVLFYTGSLKAGSDVNYFFEPFFVWAVLAAPSLDLLKRLVSESREKEICFVTIILCAVVWAPIPTALKDIEYNILKPGRMQMERELQKTIDATPGEILFIANGQGMRIGKGITLHDIFNASYLETEKKIDLSSFAERINRREFGAILTVPVNGEGYGYTIMPPSFLEPLTRNYKTVKIFAHYEWMVPREHPLPVHTPEFPQISGPETLVFNTHMEDIKIGVVGERVRGIELFSAGYLEKEIEIPRDGQYQLDLYALSSEFPGTWAQATVSVGGEFLHVFTVDEPYLTRFSARGWIHKGSYPLRIVFSNSQYGTYIASPAGLKQYDPGQDPDWQFKPHYSLSLLVNRLEVSPVPENNSVTHSHP